MTDFGPETRTVELIREALDEAWELKLCSHEFEECPLELIEKKLQVMSNHTANETLKYRV